MTRRDYILLGLVFAKCLRDARQECSPEDDRVATIYSVARDLADELHRDNPKFDSQTFLDAIDGIGVPKEVKRG